MREMDILRSIMGLSTGVARLFRNNTGTFWAGKAERFNNPGAVLVQPGDVVIRSARPVDCGLCIGSSDLIGWVQVKITPDMVGRTVALFTAIEVKPEGGRVTPAQRQFLDVVRNMGGLGGVCRSVEEAEAVLSAANKG